MRRLTVTLLAVYAVWIALIAAPTRLPVADVPPDRLRRYRRVNDYGGYVEPFASMDGAGAYYDMVEEARTLARDFMRSDKHPYGAVVEELEYPHGCTIPVVKEIFTITQYGVGKSLH